ncbi:MAG TPA: hypothetical protein VF950_06175 [Planctomycetota bacterium]
MTKYVLECPDCEARFDLKKYAPERRVRCQRCGAVVEIPFAPGDPAGEKAAAKELPPELRRKVVRILSLRRLAILAFLLSVAAAGGAAILVQRREARRAAVPKAPEPPKVTLKTLPTLLNALALPLGRGFSWEYALNGGGTERREILKAWDGPDGVPEFELGIRGSSQAGSLTLRATKDGALLLASGRATFDPPIPFVPHPLYTDGAWSQEAAGRLDNGATEAWKIAYQGVRVEKVQCPAGTFELCVRVEVRGERGGRKVEETHWYARGVGLVKRETLVDGRLETAELRKYTVKR